MHFGEYLVQKKVLSAHQILKTLAEQNRRRKYIPLLLADQGSLPDYRVLRLCSQADNNRKDFLEVLLSEKIVTSEQCKKIRRSWIQSGPPLGRLLVEMGWIDGKTCVDMLENFEARKAAEAQCDEPLVMVNLPLGSSCAPKTPVN